MSRDNEPTSPPTTMLSSPIHKTPPPPPSSSATPSRSSGQPRNNYTDETTPIASAKRPTSKRRVTTPMDCGNTPNNNNNTTNNNSSNVKRGNREYENEQLSPMHTVKVVPRDSHHTSAVTLYEKPSLEEQQQQQHSWVGRKVDALFSPVLSFLNGKDDRGEENEVVCYNDDNEIIVNGTTTSDNNDHDNVKDEQSVAVSAVIRSALLEASKELQEDSIIGNRGDEEGDYDTNHHSSVALLESYQSTSSYDDGFDNVPRMTTTDSTSKDADGDLVMHTTGGSSCSDSNAIQHANGETSRGRNHTRDANGHATTIGLQLSISQEEDLNNNNEYNNDYQDDDSDYKGHTTNESDNYEQDEEEEEFNPFLFIKSLPPYQYAIPPGWTTRSKALPPLDPHQSSVPPICLVLDLDETLVHCTVEPIPNADMVFPVEFNGVEYTVHVRCRPFLTEFLERVSREFEVVVFTASQQVYADKLLDKIDPGEYLVKLWFCWLDSVFHSKKPLSHNHIYFNTLTHYISQDANTSVTACSATPASPSKATSSKT